MPVCLPKVAFLFQWGVIRPEHERIVRSQRRIIMTEEIRICEKPFLTLKEAAVYTGLGINKLRELSNENNCDFVLFVGTKRLLKRERLLEFLNSLYSI